MGKPHLGTENQLLLVANAHMHWDPEYSDVKLVQTMMFLSEVKNIIDKASRSLQSSVAGESGTIPLVLCADLNSLPDSGRKRTVVFCNVLFDKDLWSYCDLLNQAQVKKSVCRCSHDFGGWDRWEREREAGDWRGGGE